MNGGSNKHPSETYRNNSGGDLEEIWCWFRNRPKDAKGNDPTWDSACKSTLSRGDIGQMYSSRNGSN
jgi:hypothetical protein